MISLDDYRNVEVSPNFRKPHMTKRDVRKSKREALMYDFDICIFLFSAGTIFAAVAFATQEYVLSLIGILWVMVYYIVIIAKAGSGDGCEHDIYLLVDKILEPDEDTGMNRCMFVIWQDSSDAYYVTEDVPYQIYQKTKVGDWIFMYRDRDGLFTIPDHPNDLWHERRFEFESTQTE